MPGRAGQVRDVVIDSVGAVLGVAVVVGIRRNIGVIKNTDAVEQLR